MVTKSKKRGATTDVNEPQKKSPRIKKNQDNAAAENNTEKQATLLGGKGKGKSKKVENKPETPLKQQKPAKGKQEKVGKAQKKKGPAKKEAQNNVTEETVPKKQNNKPAAKNETGKKEDQGNKFSKSVKARLSKKNRIEKLKEKAQQGDTQTLAKIQEVINKLQGSGQKTKHSKRKLAQYKNVLAIFSKEGKSTPKKTAKKISKASK